MKKDNEAWNNIVSAFMCAAVKMSVLHIIWVLTELIVLGRPNPNDIDTLVGVIIFIYVCWAETKIAVLKYMLKNEISLWAKLLQNINKKENAE